MSGTDGGTVFLLLHRCCPHFRSKGGIITGLGNFIAILMACLIVRNERMTGRKMAGCVLGFAGVVVINLMGKSLDMGFTLTGEGFILISQVAYGISTI